MTMLPPLRNQGIGDSKICTIFQGKGYLKPIPRVSSGMLFSQVGNYDAYQICGHQCYQN
jgi:hypothetical protein